MLPRICHPGGVPSSSTPADDAVPAPVDAAPATESRTDPVAPSASETDDAPTTSTVAAPAEPARQLPTAVRIAVILMSLLAGLFLVLAYIIWSIRDQAITNIVAAGHKHADAERAVLFTLLAYAAVGLLLALSAYFLPRRMAWARFLGLGVTGLLTLLTLYTLISSPTLESLLVLLVSMGAVASLLAKGSATWIPRRPRAKR
jgi:magnesium-transporting ATPase (P-type)